MTVPNKIFNVQGFAKLGCEYTGGELIWYTVESTINETALDPGLDEMVRAEMTYHAAYWSINISPALDHFHLNWGILPYQAHSYALKEVASGANSSGIMHLRAYSSGAGVWLNSRQDLLVANGVYIYSCNLDPSDPDENGEKLNYTGYISSLKVFFLNPIVNSLSRLWAPTAGEVEVILTGLGFNNVDSELETGGQARPGGWNDEVDEIEFIGLQGQGSSVYRDDFDDESRDEAWTDDPNNGTITESGDVLTLALGSGVVGDFWTGIKEAPITYITPGQDTLTIIAKLNSYTVNDLTRTGIYITSSIDGGTGIGFGRMRNDGNSLNGLQVMEMGVGPLAYVSLTTLPVWLRVRAEGSGNGSVIYFDYSTDGVEWTNLHTLNNETWDKIGLVTQNWDVHNAISTPYEFFKYSYDIPSATLSRTGGDFTVDNNTQITIPANKFPALPAGTYHVNLKKINVSLNEATTITGYAGDWACDPDGTVSASNRISFYVSDVYITRESRERKGPLILTDWHLKSKVDGSLRMKYYAMDYLRCPDRVYKGNLTAISSISRGFEGKTGLFKVSDLTLDLANNDLEFSKLLAGNTVLKNQKVEIFQAYPDELFGWRSHIVSMIIDDYFLEDEIFKVKMKDITQKYFRRKVPTEVCTEAEYPSIHPDSISATIPEVLGLCSLTTGEFRGQIEAICIDTVNYKYVAANRALTEITEVYADDIVAMGSEWYSVSVEDDGRTYITFVADQENKKVTFNCKGYSYAGFNSGNDYVQNPAYIILYFLLVIMSIPSEMIDFASFVSLADIYENMGEDESGKLILQDQQDPMDTLKDLLAGAKIFPGKDGRLTMGKKDLSNYATNNSNVAPVIFRQLDAIGKSSRKYNMRDAINKITAEYDYSPTWDLFKSNVSDRAEVWIEPWDFEQVIIEDDRIITRPRRERPKRREWLR